MTTAGRRAISRRTVCAAASALVGALVTGCGSTASPGSAGSDGSAGRAAAATRTVRAGRLVVTGDVPTPRLQSVARDATTAVDRVRKVWGAGALPDPLLVEVPADDSGFRTLGGSAESGAQIAATTTPDGRVVLAPALFNRVTEQGRIVVLTHEFTHVTLHQENRPGLARWIVEGAAEFTAYHATGLSVSRLTPQLTKAVRAGRVPVGPPSEADFDAAPQAAYQQAYAWCAFLVDRFGLPRFTTFVRSAHTGGRQEFVAAFGVSVGSLRSPFQTFLRAGR
ncbi:M35 family metalloendopeptidase [Flexivirga lutea]